MSELCCVFGILFAPAPSWRLLSLSPPSSQTTLPFFRGILCISLTPPPPLQSVDHGLARELGLQKQKPRVRSLAFSRISTALKGVWKCEH